jgi:hypothetical protein
LTYAAVEKDEASYSAGYFICIPPFSKGGQGGFRAVVRRASATKSPSIPLLQRGKAELQLLNKFSVKRLGLLVVVAAGLSAVSSAAPAVGQSSSSDACSTADQLTPAIDLATTIEQFVQEMPAGDSNGYRNPLSDLNARNAIP